MALGPEDLTTVERVKTLLKSVPSGKYPELEESIHDYSRAAIDFTGREFRRSLPDPDVDVERKFVYDDQGYLNLEPFEARQITELRVYAGTEPAQVLAVGDSRAMPVQKSPESTYLWLKVRSPFLGYLGNPVPASFLDDYVIGVVGRWGTASVPWTVNRAVAIAVAHAYRSPEGFQRRGLGAMDLEDVIETDPEELVLSLPRASRNLLRPYQRPDARRRHRQRTA